LVIHGFVATLGTGFLALGFALSLTQLLQTRREQRGVEGKPARLGWLTRLPDSAQLENYAYRLIIIGFIFWTFTLIAGAIWAQDAWGRYWGALERVDCLHFEACYYQPLQWCITNGFSRFEGGAQGEHKMARALMPVMTTSAHWLAHPAFADAVQRFLEKEGEGMEGYLEHLEARTPFRQP
jgi:predicted N-acyltransferase